MTSQNQISSQRQFHLDYLRVFASIAIILLHVSGQNMPHVELVGTDWSVFNFYNGATRWGVPVFIMMSGALFLPREIPIKTIYKKYILRMAIAYVVWSAFYALVNPIGKLVFEDGYRISFVEIINTFIAGEVHLWFLPMIIGLYMCLPIIKSFTKSDKTTIYFLLLSLIFYFFKTEAELISTYFLEGDVQSVFKSISTLFKNFHMDLVMGLVSYFILGYYLNKTDIKKGHRLTIYFLGIVGFAATIILNLSASKNAEQSLEVFYGATTLNVLLMSTAMFVWFKYNVKGNKHLNKIIPKLSKYSFGAFLTHIFILKMLTSVGIHASSFSPILSVPIITLVTTVASYLISFILNKIPVIKKYIV